VERSPEKYRLEPLLFPPRDVFPAMQSQNGRSAAPLVPSAEETTG
jgi:hypothetical protein